MTIWCLASFNEPKSFFFKNSYFLVAYSADVTGTDAAAFKSSGFSFIQYFVDGKFPSIVPYYGFGDDLTIRKMFYNDM